MRQLKRNKQTLYYALYSNDEIIYAKDEDGNILTTPVDGVLEPVIDSVYSGYSTPVKFEANISFNSGETSVGEYGLNTGDYSAVISADKGVLPFNEQTLIWHSSEPLFDTLGAVKPESADYRVIAIKTSLNEERFILSKRIDGDGSPLPST